MIQMITGTENFDKALEKGDMIAGFSAPWSGYCRRGAMGSMGLLPPLAADDREAVGGDRHPDLRREH